DLVRRAIDLVLTMALPVLGEYGPGGIASNHLDLRIALLEIPPDSSDRTAGSCGRDEVRDLPFGLLPQFGTRRFVMRFGIRGVVKLVGENRVRRFSGDALRHHHVIVGMVRRDGGR